MRPRGARRRSLSLLALESRRLASVVALSVGVAASRVAEPVLFGRFMDAFGRLRPHDGAGVLGVWRVMGGWAAVGGAGVFVSLLAALSADRLVHRLRWRVVKDYFVHVLSLSPAFHGRQPAGALVRTALDANTFLYTTWLQLLRQHLPSLLTIVFLVPVTLAMNWRLACILLALLAAFVALNAFVSAHTDRGQKQVHSIDLEIGKHIGDVLDNTILVQSFTRTQQEAETLSELISDIIRTQFPVLNFWAGAFVLTRAFSVVSVLLIFGYGVLSYQSGETSLGQLVSFSVFATLIISSLEQMTAMWLHISTYKPLMERFFEVVDTSEKLEEHQPAVDMPVVKGSVAFEGVGFRYPDGQVLLNDVSFEVAAGTTVALVGGTGAGKSTIMGLLCRFWDPDRGRILIDGVDIRHVPLHALREAVGVVFQDNPVLHRSLADNLAFGKSQATREEMEAMLDRVLLDQTLKGRDRGLATVLEGGRQALSGGERQRLGIARALLKDPPILVLDEATSGLDTLTERRIQRLFGELRRGKTTLIIAHRLSTIRCADLILVMENGRIVERGSFDALAAGEGLFAELVAAGDLSAAGGAVAA